MEKRFTDLYRFRIYQGKLDDLSVTLLHLSECESLQGNKPPADWYYGRQIKERNDVLMKLLAELIIGKYLTGLSE